MKNKNSRSTRKKRKTQKGGFKPENLNIRTKTLEELFSNSKRFKNPEGNLMNKPTIENNNENEEKNAWDSVKKYKQNDLEFPMKFVDAIHNATDNNGDYSWYKYTILPTGTRLYFRSKNKITVLQNRSRDLQNKWLGMWLNYSTVTGKPSYIIENKRTDSKILQGMIKKFGPYLNLVETTQPLKILHFPVDYTKTKSTDLHSYTSEIEPVIRAICADRPDFFNTNNICVDGYTLDFLYRSENAKEALTDIGKNVKGFREICLLGTGGKEPKIKLISSVEDNPFKE